MSNVTLTAEYENKVILLRDISADTLLKIVTILNEDKQVKQETKTRVRRSVCKYCDKKVKNNHALKVHVGRLHKK